MKTKGTKSNFIPAFRTNPVTGEDEIYFPVPLYDEDNNFLQQLYSDALTDGLQIGNARLWNNRVYRAVFVPCRESGTVNGKTVYIDTPYERQMKIFNSYYDAYFQDPGSIDRITDLFSELNTFDDGTVENDIPATCWGYESDIYEDMVNDILNYVRDNYPEYHLLTLYLINGYSVTEISKMLSKPRSTVTDMRSRLRNLLDFIKESIS